MLGAAIDAASLVQVMSPCEANGSGRQKVYGGTDAGHNADPVSTLGELEQSGHDPKADCGDPQKPDCDNRDERDLAHDRSLSRRSETFAKLAAALTLRERRGTGAGILEESVWPLACHERAVAEAFRGLLAISLPYL